MNVSWLYMKRDRAINTAVMRRWGRKKKLTAVILKGERCHDCGMDLVKNPECADFDHMKPRRTPKGPITRQRSEAMRDELNDCNLVCANCHRTRTQRRLENKHKIPPFTAFRVHNRKTGLTEVAVVRDPNRKRKIPVRRSKTTISQSADSDSSYQPALLCKAADARIPTPLAITDWLQWKDAETLEEGGDEHEAVLKAWIQQNWTPQTAHGGFWHQEGGVPLFSDGKVLTYGMRGWGHMVYEALHPNEADSMGYCTYAWISPSDKQ